jgi:hypothetical protein
MKVAILSEKVLFEMLMFPKWVFIFNEIVKLIKKTLNEPATLPRRYYSKLHA